MVVNNARALTGPVACRQSAAAVVAWCAAMLAVSAEPGPPAEWGAVSFEALCRAGMPSAECLDAPGASVPPARGGSAPSGPTGKLACGQADTRSELHTGPLPPQTPPPPLPLPPSQLLPPPGGRSNAATQTTSHDVAPAQYSIAVPGHRQVVGAAKLKTIVYASAGSPLPLASDFKLVIEGHKVLASARESDSIADTVHREKFIDGRSWKLADMMEDQRPSHSRPFSYIFAFDLPPGADGPLQISLLFHPGEEGGWEEDEAAEGGIEGESGGLGAGVGKGRSVGARGGGGVWSTAVTLPWTPLLLV
jgi:hypothetical protein